MTWVDAPQRRRDGRLVQKIHWREGDKHRSKTVPAHEPRLVQLHVEWARAQERKAQGRAAKHFTTDAEEALRAFLSHLRVGRAPATVRYYAERLQPVWDALSVRPMAEWTQTHLEAFVQGKRDAGEGWSARTIQMTRQACKAFLRWAEGADVVVADFVGSFKAPTVYRGVRKHLSRAQVETLLDHARGHHLEVAIGLAALAGLRRGEFLGARAEHIDWSVPELLVRGTKTHRDRTVPIHERLLEILERRRVLGGPLVRISPNASNNTRALQRLCRAAGVPEVSWHPLRHTFASLMVRKPGTNLTAVRDLMGHANLSTTSLYLHTDREDHQAAVASLLEGTG